MSDMKITAVAPWFGSNRTLASEVGAMMGRQQWIGVPFAGGMCELPHLQARTVIANDLHRHVVNLAATMANPTLGPDLYRKLRRLVLHPDFVIVAQQRCEQRELAWANTSDSLVGDRERVRGCGVAPDLLWAVDYFVSAWFSRSHAAGADDEFSNGISIRWNASGGDSAKRVQSAIRSIPAWRRALKNTTFTTMDALAFMAKCKDESGHGIYCDPPFPGPGDRYRHKIDAAYQQRLAEQVAQFDKTRVVMRFYDHPMIRELYPTTRWAWHHFVGRTQANADAPEVLLTNTGERANTPSQLFAESAA